MPGASANPCLSELSCEVSGTRTCGAELNEDSESCAGMLLAAWLFSLLTTILPAWQASRIYPAEALRYE